MATLPGYKIWQYLTPLTTAASPLVSPWLDTTGFTIVLPWFLFAGGTSVHSLEGSFDGSTLDTDLTAAYAAPTSLTPITVVSPFIRWRTVQTVSNATTSKIFLQSRA